MDKTIFIITGEPSADLHGAHLACALKSQNPKINICGVGSTNMRKQGVKTFADLAQYAVIGFVEVLKHYPIYKKVFDLTLKKIEEFSPEAIILIDYPGFNLRLAKRIKKDFPDTKIIYYISPQVWAWGRKRITLIKKTIDHMIVLFEFEKKLYNSHKVPCTFVGHPLSDSMKSLVIDENLRKDLNLKPEDIVIGLLPGSRTVEVKRILPVMIESAKIIHKNNPGIKFILLKGEHIKQSLIDQSLNSAPHLPILIAHDKRYEHLQLCSFALVCSGTATLETAILEVPMIIIYKTSFLTWLISKILINLPYIGLINVVAEKKIVEEFIQFQATAKNISEYLEKILKNKNSLNTIRNNIITAKNKLGSTGANQQAAKTIISMLKN